MKNNLKDIKESKTEQLYKDLAKANKDLREIRFKIANREVKDPNQKNKLRKQIARLWTVIREKEYQSLIETK